MAVATRQLIEVAEARRIVLAEASPLPVENAPLGEALGRVLAEEVAAADPVPGFDNSAMDGFAVRAADTSGAAPGKTASLRLVGESRAGSPAEAALRPGEAIRISTGAMLPEGADAVIRLEQADELDGRVETETAVVPGRDVRRAGEDIARGETVLRTGTAVGPAELGVLASVGRESLACARRATISIVTTGDELLSPGEPMRPGGVRNSNAWTLSALVRLSGAEVRGVGRAGDDPNLTRTAIGDALDADVAVISGGVSVGEHDHVRAELAELGVEQRFWGVALRPGRPTWFGTHGLHAGDGGGLVFGLPGNPVSAYVTFLLLVRPAIRALHGTDPKIDRATAIFDASYEKGPGRTHAVRVRLRLADDGWHAEPTREAQGSHVLTSMLGADALALVPSERERIAAGERVEVELL